MPDNAASRWRYRCHRIWGSGTQINGNIFANSTNVLPSAPGRVWYEADIGLSNMISRGNQPGTRLLYSNDGQLYITTDHYQSAKKIGTWR